MAMLFSDYCTRKFYGSYLLFYISIWACPDFSDPAVFQNNYPNKLVWPKIIRPFFHVDIHLVDIHLLLRISKSLDNFFLMRIPEIRRTAFRHHIGTSVVGRDLFTFVAIFVRGIVASLFLVARTTNWSHLGLKTRRADIQILALQSNLSWGCSFTGRCKTPNVIYYIYGHSLRRVFSPLR